jgi:hypothetical protein
MVVDGTQSKRKRIIQALEDALIVGAAALASSLIAVGWPPSIPVLYVPILSATLIGITTYAKARQIDLSVEDGQ